MSTYTVLTEPDSSERLSSATSIRLKLEKDAYLTIEDKALIAHSAGAEFDNSENNSISDRLRRTLGGDATTVRRVTATADDGAFVAVGSGTVEPRAVIALEVDSLNDKNFSVSDGAWVAHTDGVESDVVWKGFSSAWARERIAMSHFTGQGLLIVEGPGTITEKTLGDGESIVLGQARLLAYSDTVDLNSESVAGRQLMTVSGPGVVVYKTHAENV